MNDTALLNPLAIAGNNMPPVEPTPFEIVEKKIGDLYTEAAMWMDGEPIASQAQADDIANLMAMIRTAEAEAEALRVAEKKPLDVQIAEIQSRFAPLIADTKAVKGKTVRAIEACKSALAPWLQKIADEKAQREAAARAVADEARRVAEEAIRATSATNILAREEAEELVKDAKRAEQAANRIGREAVTAGGSFGRAVSMRTVYVASITDPVIFARHVWREEQPEMIEFLTGLADRLVRNGARELPGVTITEERKAV
jgi:hypothetical protein